MLILTLGTVIRAMTLFMTFPYFSLYVLDLGGDNVVLGMVNALRPLAAMFMFPIAGSLVDNYGKKKILVITEYLTSALFIVYMLAPEWRVLALANFISGLMVFRFPASSALLAESMPPGMRGRGFAFLILIPGLIGIFTPYLGGYLLTYLGIQLGMRVLYGASVVGIAVVATLDWKYLIETGEPVDNPKPLGELIRGSYRETLVTLKSMTRSLRWLASVIMILLFFNSVSGAYWVLYAKDVIGLTTIEWGILLTISTVIYTGLSYPAGALYDKYDKTKILALAMLLSVAPILYFPSVTGFTGALLVMGTVSIANGFLMSGAGALMADLTPQVGRGKMMAALGRGMLFVNTRSGGGGGPGMGFLLTFPSVLGLMAGGYVYNYSRALPWYLLGAAELLAAAMMWFLIKPKD